ncbi:MAG TPA: class I SAM-dependent methyltransferase [Thermoanaerobaculia bacterium]|jgi:2-polyprenyl-3-methyl-5-hydroxy-6-metoxy-1,4-benzoquinol methylase|nr:class I SAM-dependent methyltransferase [Thermoanaerobaculia bacterium]
MPPAVLVPVYDHPALEERYASWQTQMLLRRDHATLELYDADEPAAHAVDAIEEEHVLVITDPLMLPSSDLGDRLQRVLGDAFAAVPAANDSGEARQHATIRPYMTLREFQQAAEELYAAQTTTTDRFSWGTHNPGAFLCTTASLRTLQVPLAKTIEGRDVALARGTLIHRWASLRGQTRHDLLDRISLDAKSILEFGCGEAPLGEALKKRQKCRVVGVELDRQAAAIARKRIDDVYCGDVREIVALLHERFDCIVGGDIIEHLDEPWSFLAELRRISAPGGQLLLSLPNVANASVVGDLLQGRFDYVYMGLTCVGHLRFFTRQTVAEMLNIAGWEVVAIEPQSLAQTKEQTQLLEGLRAAGIPFAESEIAPSGFYVMARNPGST